MAEYYVYIMSNPSRTLYTGVTNDLQRRVYEHKQKLVEGFTKRYDLTTLVYYEATSDVGSALAREKQIKGWLRRKKVALVESTNPKWREGLGRWVVRRRIGLFAALRVTGLAAVGRSRAVVLTPPEADGESEAPDPSPG